nr:hypothetical protein [uncultured Butyrivibrio sp.]
MKIQDFVNNHYMHDARVDSFCVRNDSICFSVYGIDNKCYEIEFFAFEDINYDVQVFEYSIDTELNVIGKLYHLCDIEKGHFLDEYVIITDILGRDGKMLIEGMVYDNTTFMPKNRIVIILYSLEITVNRDENIKLKDIEKHNGNGRYCDKKEAE